MVKKFIFIFMLILSIFSINAITDTNLIFYSSGDTMTTNPSTIYGGVTDNIGILGRSGNFDGINDYIDTGLTNANLQGDISFSVWVKIPSYLNQNFIIDSDAFPGGLNARGYFLYTSSIGEVVLGINTPLGQTAIKSNTLVNLNQWVYITTTWDSVTNSPKIYINGVLDNSNILLNLAVGSVSNNNEPLKIGLFSASPGIYGNNDIDEVSIYNKVLTQQEVTNLYQAGNPTQNSNSIVTGELYYNDFEFLKDDTGLTNEMSGFNGLGIGNLGKLSTGFNFDGVNDYATITTVLSPISGTINVWSKSSDLVGSECIICGRSSNANADRVYIYTSGANVVFNMGSTTITITNGLTTNWQQYSMTWDGNIVKTYINGIFKGQFSYTSFTFPSFIGVGILKYTDLSFNAQYLNGNIDEVSIWDRILSPTEIIQLYNNDVGLTYNQIKNPIQMSVITPQDLANYTFDVINVPVTINTAIATNCSLTNDFDNATILFTNTGDLAHSTNLNLPVAINQSQTFNVDFTCNNGVDTQSTILKLFKQRIPLSLDIIVPKANQIFNVDTGQIEFFLETNYQTDCSYQRDIEFVRTPFTSTGGAFHKTNFTTDLNVSTYNMNFLCIGNIINENASKNITFFLDELTKFSLTRTTTQLPQVGEDIGGFFGNLAPSVVEFMLNFAIITLIVSMVVVPIIFIRKFGK